MSKDTPLNYPLRSPVHGSDTIKVIVGKNEDAQSFTMNRDLLCFASTYFDGALNDGFKEIFSGLELPSDCPLAFEVLYQWLYGGKVKDDTSWYTEDTIPSDLLWLRVYKMADCRLVKPLVEVAYDRLKSYFAPKKRVSPSAGMLLELYDETGPQHLQRYVALHTAFEIHRGLTDPAIRIEFHQSLNCEISFGAAVASRLMDMHSSSSSQKLPSTMEEFKTCRPRSTSDAGELLK